MKGHGLRATKLSDGTVTLSGSIPNKLKSQMRQADINAVQKAIKDKKPLNVGALKAVLGMMKPKAVRDALIGFAGKQAGSKDSKLTLRDTSKGDVSVNLRNKENKLFRTLGTSLESLQRLKNLVPKTSIQNPALAGKKSEMGDGWNLINKVEGEAKSDDEKAAARYLGKAAVQFTVNSEEMKKGPAAIARLSDKELKALGKKILKEMDNQGVHPVMQNWFKDYLKGVKEESKKISAALGGKKSEMRQEQIGMSWEKVKENVERLKSENPIFISADTSSAEAQLEYLNNTLRDSPIGSYDPNSPAGKKIREDIKRLEKEVAEAKSGGKKKSNPIADTLKQYALFSAFGFGPKPPTGPRTGGAAAALGGKKSEMRRRNPETGVIEFQKGGLMPDTIKNSIPKLYAQDGMGDKARVYLKLFNPVGSQTWYITEFDGKDTMFGYVTGMGENELGYVSLKEMQGLQLMGGAMGIERDIHWDNRTTLGDVKAGREYPSETAKPKKAPKKPKAEKSKLTDSDKSALIEMLPDLKKLAQEEKDPGFKADMEKSVKELEAKRKEWGL